MGLRLFVPFDGVGSVLDVSSTLALILFEVGFAMVSPRTLSFRHTGTLPTRVIHSSPESYIFRFPVIGEGVSGFGDDRHSCFMEGGLLVPSDIIITGFDGQPANAGDGAGVGVLLELGVLVVVGVGV